jgi:hypothetical protein
VAASDAELLVLFGTELGVLESELAEAAAQNRQKMSERATRASRS